MELVHIDILQYFLNYTNYQPSHVLVETFCLEKGQKD